MYFKPIEDQLFSMPQFIKHVPMDQRCDVVRSLKGKGIYYYATDFTAFESHMSPDIMNSIECVLYRHCYPGDRNIESICEMLTGKNKISTRGGVHATCLGRRMSGDMCTSLGNGFTNFMLASFLVHKKHGKLSGLFEGDDGLFTTTVPLTNEDYDRLGFSIKIQRVDDPCSASFCGMIFPNSGQMIRSPYKFVQGFGWTSSFIHAGDKVMNSLLRAKCLSAAYEMPQCPIVGVFARRGLQVTRGSKPRFVVDHYHDQVCPDEVNIPDFRPSDDTRELFHASFGVTIENQLIIEEAIRNDDFVLVGNLLRGSAPVSMMPSILANIDYSTRYLLVT